MDPRNLFGISDEKYGVEIQDAEFLGRLIPAHPEWTTVIEFGTYMGMTALWMGYLLQQQGGRLVTVDQSDGRDAEVLRYWLPNMEFFTMDILTTPINPSVASLVRHSAPCLVIIDNGNKIAEVNRYAPHLQPGSAFCVHDFGTTSKGPHPNGEVDLEDIQETLTACHFAPVMHEEAEAMRTLFRCWVRQ